MKKPAFINKILIALITILVIVVGSAYFVNNAIQSIVKEIRDEAAPDERIILLKGMMYKISNAENSVKSYGLTKNENYLDDYNLSIKAINRKVRDLKKQTKEDGKFAEKTQRLDTLINQKFANLDQLIIIQNSQSVDSLIEKVQEKVADVTIQSTTKENSVTSIEKARFFKRVFGNRTKESNENTIDKKKLKNIEEPFAKIDRELDRIKTEETKIEFLLKSKELALIRKDKSVMDEIAEIVLEIENIEIANMQDQIAASEKQGNETSTLIGLFCLISAILLILAAYVIYKYVVENTAYKNDLISAKNETELKNREIFSSLNYAKRIQNVILPDAQRIQHLFPNSFIIYKPKDIVAGDFYWMVEFENYKFIAVADCTGHGVPGAMVSMACSSALNRTVKEFGIIEPAAILDKCRELIIDAFDESTESVYDGMDISLCRIDEKKGKIEFAGANNSLFVINKGELTILKANKQPVARFEKPTPFTNQLLDYKKGDTFYLFTDGFSDQLGGHKRKKFMSGQFKKLLTTNAHLELDVQKKGIMTTLKNWQGQYEQVDDICIIGFRI